jgi:NTE family protein
MAFDGADVLVLGGGGVLGEAWISAVLAGLEEASGFDATACGGYVGTSAGSIVAAVLAAGISPAERLGELPEQPADEATGGGGPGDGANGGGSASEAAADVVRRMLATGALVTGPLAAVTLRSAAPAGALLRRTVLARTRRGTHSLRGLGERIEKLGARFDGRLAVAAVDLDTGRRVMFGREGAPQASVGDAMEASCAIPGWFRPIEIGGRDYIDGGVWSPTNMDEAQVERGQSVLCLNPTGALPARAAPLGLLSRSVARVEALALERRGARVRIEAPDAASLEAIGLNLMDRRRRPEVIAAGVEQGRRLAA